MATIAYITDGKMLENHRLNQNKRMNFWRLNANTNFKDFGIGGLIFFLSKNKEHLSINHEKGVIGFGRVVNIYSSSPKMMWAKFNKGNGYNTYEEFAEAVRKVSKTHELPEKMSSLYLENVCFFQAPIYLSELGIEISKSVESYVYIKPDEAVIKLLEYGKKTTDIWSRQEDEIDIIQKEEIALILSLANANAKDLDLNGESLNNALDDVQSYLIKHPIYQRIFGSKLNMFNIYEDILTIVFYHNDEIDINEVVQKAKIFKEYINKYYPNDLSILFKTTDDNEEFSELVY